MSEVAYRILKWRDCGPLESFNMATWDSARTEQFNALMRELTKPKAPRPVTHEDILRWAGDHSSTFFPQSMRR